MFYTINNNIMNHSSVCLTICWFSLSLLASLQYNLGDIWRRSVPTICMCHMSWS